MTGRVLGSSLDSLGMKMRRSILNVVGLFIVQPDLGREPNAKSRGKRRDTAYTWPGSYKRGEAEDDLQEDGGGAVNARRPHPSAGTGHEKGGGYWYTLILGRLPIQDRNTEGA